MTNENVAELLRTRRLGVMDATYGWDESAARWLRKLIGDAVTRGMAPTQHPLGRGFAALRRSESAAALTEEEANALAELKLIGQTLLELKKSWWPFRQRLVAELGDASRCLSLLFELHTARAVLKGTAGLVLWNSFKEALPDIEMRRPRLMVECKLLRSERRNRLEIIKEAAEQHADLQAPLVVSVGVSREMSREEIAEVIAEIPGWREWFLSNRRVAAGVIFSPMTPPPVGVSDERVTAAAFKYQSITIVRSRLAAPLLPDGYVFRGEDRGTEVAIGSGQS